MRLTYDGVVKKCRDKGFELISNIYKNNKTYIVIQDTNGYLYRAKMDTYKNWDKLKPFNRLNKFHEYNISLWFKNKPYKLITLVGGKKQVRVVCECKECGKVWETRFSRLYTEGTGCPICSRKTTITVEQVKACFEQRGFIPLFTEYRKAKDKLDFKDNFGYMYSSTYDTFSRGNPCKFEPHNPYSIDNIRHYLKLNNISLECLSDTYERYLGMLSFKCTECGYEWDTSFASIQMGSGCPECARRNSGFYTEYRANKNKDKWLNIEAKVYLLKCFNENEEFYKIGITSQKIEKRLTGVAHMPYNYEVLGFVKTNKYDSVFLEKELHEINKGNSYTPSIKFGGYTECFSDISSEVYVKMKGCDFYECV